MSDDKEPRRKRASSKSTLTKKDDFVILEVAEFLVNTQIARGAYNAEKFYGHVVAKPREALIVKVPVSALGEVSTIKEVIEKLEKEVIDGIDAQVKLREGRGTGVTQVTEIGDVSYLGKPRLQSVVGDEDDSQF